MFKLTPNEQRVVILVILALLTAAFVRYWRDAHSPYAPKPGEIPAAAPTPAYSPPNTWQLEECDDAPADEHRSGPLPIASP